MFKEDTQGNTYYLSKSNREYQLLIGITNKGYTSDIVFIFKEATPEEMEKGYYGEVVDWVYDGFSDLSFIEQKILEHEKKN